jgi:hypothetical protein
MMETVPMNNICRNGLFAVWLLLYAGSPLHAEETPASGSHLSAETATKTTGGKTDADDSDDTRIIDMSRIRFSGFGTIGLMFTGDKKLRFIRPSTNYPGSENPDFGPDTMLGAQANLPLGSNAAIVIQAVSREDTAGSYDPRAKLAFFSYALAPTLTVRIGRLRTPFFMFSETIDINYASPWIRPPTEIYSMFPFNELDGIDFLLRTNLGRFNIELHPYFGSSRLTIYQGGRGYLKNTRGLNITVTDGQLTVFASHGETDFSLKWKGSDFQALSGALAYAPNGGDILRDISGSNGSGTFSAAGIQWDDRHWLFIAEYNQLRSNRYTHDAHAWEITAARRFGDFTPYLTFARHTEDKPVTSKTTGIPILDEYVRAFTSARNLSQRSVTLGTRWDFYRNTALKLEYNHARIAGHSWGSFFPTNINNTRLENRTVNTVGISVDVTF